VISLPWRRTETRSEAKFFGFTEASGGMSFAVPRIFTLIPRSRLPLRTRAQAVGMTDPAAGRLVTLLITVLRERPAMKPVRPARAPLTIPKPRSALHRAEVC